MNNNINIRINFNDTVLFNSQEYVNFRSKYKEFVFNMNSREFAQMILKEGGEQTRINIIYEMCMMNSYMIPIKLLNVVLDKKLHPKPDYIKLFFENIDDDNEQNLNKFDMTMKNYCQFKDFVSENFGHISARDLPNYITFKNYFIEKEQIELEIANLTQLDCELMKIAHLQ